MNKETAEWVAAEQVLAKLQPPHGDEFVVTSTERVRETWVVYWNSKRYVETKRFTDALGGNGPVLVADDYSVGQAGTAESVDFYVQEFENRS